MALEIEWRRSPNFTKKPNRPITCIVLHATATKGIESPLAWLCDPKSKVSCHYLVDLTGKVYKLVQEYDEAWHSGVSTWRGQDGVNLFSLGIEMVNPNDGKTPYPSQQVDAVKELCVDLMFRHGIHIDNVVCHYDIAPGRKNDPKGFNMETFKHSLEAA